MSTIDQNNDIFKAKRDSGNQRISDKETLLNNELQNDEFEDIHQSNEEIAKRGYTVRNGYDPNKPNPDQEKITNDEDDLDDLDDDFHTERDLEHDDYIEEDLDDDGEILNITNDEFDNPSDDFNETEDVLEDIDEDEDEDEDEDDDYKEDDVQEEDEDDDFEEEEEEQEEDYPANDPRKF